MIQFKSNYTPQQVHIQTLLNMWRMGLPWEKIDDQRLAQILDKIDFKLD